MVQATQLVGSPTTRRARAILIAGDQAGSPGVPTPGALDSLAIIESDLRARFPAPYLAIERLPASPTRELVAAAFARITPLLAHGDLFVVMFAGHGRDADDTLPAQAWCLTGDAVYTDIELAETLRGLPSGVDTVVICDCCYGEGFFVAGAAARALRNGRMVCISAASSAGMVTLTKLAELAHDTVAAAGAGRSYAELKHAFSQQKFTGREFHIDARPAHRIHDPVLAAILANDLASGSR